MKITSVFLLALLVMLPFAGTSTQAGAPDAWSAKATGSQAGTNSKSTATTRFHVNTKYGGLYYEINVSKLSNLHSVHVHLGRPGERGPVVATLLSGTGSRGAQNGRIHVGILFGSGLVGPFDTATRLDPLINEIRNGNAYVDFHTDDGDDTRNTGPGDFADGEIRGQIR